MVTYKALITACAKGKRSERVLKIFEPMQQQGAMSNIATYSAVISAFKKGKQPERALEIFEFMQQQRFVSR